MSVTQDITTEKTGDVKFRCVGCDEVSKATAMEQKITEKYYGMITMAVTRRTVLSCPKCQVKLQTKKKIDELSSLSPDQVAAFLHIETSFVMKFMALIGGFLFFIPIISLVLSLIAYFNIQKPARFWRKLAFVGIVLGVLFHIFFISMFVIEALKN